MKSDKKKQDVIREKKKKECAIQCLEQPMWLCQCLVFFIVFLYFFFRKQEGLAPLLNFIQKVKHKYKRGETQKVGN